MKCLICKTELNSLFKAKVLGKYDVEYFKCPKCDFIQTEKPYWLEESYSSAITDLDVGLVGRSIFDSNVVATLINNNFKVGARFLDFAGGYGLFVRLMRDKGFNYYRSDKYCENIFAKNFDITNIKNDSKFELVTAFEVFEHLDDPMGDIKKMLSHADTLVFTTEMQPAQPVKSAEDWWYFTPETGQHVAFYSEKTLRYIAKQFKMNFYCDGQYFMFSKKRFTENPFKVNRAGELADQGSLTDQDYQLAKEILSKVKVPKVTEKNKEKVMTTAERLNMALARVEITENELEKEKNELVGLRQEFSATKSELEKLNENLENNNLQLTAANNELNRIYSSLGWRGLQFIQNRIIPAGSLRRRTASFLLRMVKALYRLPRKIKNVFLKAEIIYWRLKPKKKRVINKNSKKLAYIGHSYHVKTQSTGFLIDYLKEFFDVEVVADESWKGEGDEYPDLSHFDESYVGVIFFQNLPNDLSLLKNIKNKNILFFPMYDGCSGWDYGNWRKLRGIKIMNFSKTLHEMLSKWGFESDFVQYFPEPQEFIKGKQDEVFFWQRLTFININTISQVLGKAKFKLHLHRSIDPGHEYVAPTKEQEEKYQITYSDWFEKREQMWDLIKEKAIYVAPRQYEGIGLSFLEAMAMGKAVIAVNNPTMNEYIVNTENGYLYDLSAPAEIDFSDISGVQKRTHEFMVTGYNKWEKEKHRIIDFIER